MTFTSTSPGCHKKTPSTTAYAKQTPLGSSRSSLAPKWRRCHDCDHATSTTSLLKSPSFGRARSRADLCTRTCGDEVARNPSPIYTPAWNLRYARPSECRSSKNNSCRWRSMSLASLQPKQTNSGKPWGQSVQLPRWKPYENGSTPEWPNEGSSAKQQIRCSPR